MKIIKTLLASAVVAISSCTAMQPAYANPAREVLRMEVCNAVADLSASYMEQIYKKYETTSNIFKKIEDNKSLKESPKLKSYILAGVIKYSRDTTEPLISSRREVYELCMKDYK